MTPQQSSAKAPLKNYQSTLTQLLLKIKFFFGSLFYLSYAFYAYLYSFKRDRLERKFAVKSSSQINVPGKLLRLEKIPRGGHFYFEQAELIVEFLTTDFVRITWQPGILPVPYAIEKSTWSEVDVNLDESPLGQKVSTNDLQVFIGQEGHLQFYDGTGKILREEMPPCRKGEGWSHQSKLKPEENLYGLGERATRLNLRSRSSAQSALKKEEKTPSARSYKIWNFDAAGMYGLGSDPMYISIPIYMSLHNEGSYLIFYENSFEATFTFDEIATASFEGGALRYYIATGSPPQLLERYTELTGHSPLPARWALGYHQSRWGYRTEEAVRETVKTFRSLNLPLSAIHLDIDIQVGFRAFTIDPDRFPNLGKFIQELAHEGVQFITILNPGIKYTRKSKLFLEGQMLDAFCKFPDGSLVIAPVWCGQSVFPDFTNPVVRKWWSRQYEFMLDLGIAGFWHDMNEPAAFVAWGDRSLPKVTVHMMEGRGGDHREAHNLYGLLQAKAGYESLSQYRPHRRPFIISRAGWAGLQRYAWTWTGDVECTWSAMHVTISTVIGLGLSGIPYSGSDIGGFQGNPSPELYLRWFQMATFMPLYRSHCSNNVEYRAPWTYGEPYSSIIGEFLKLRYRLMPYFYTLAWLASIKGYPLVRPLFWYHQDEPHLWGVDDSFYLGESMLVYPVLEEKAQSRSITLPKGRWYSFWDDVVKDGGKSIEVEVTLNQIPLFIKAGTILPMTSELKLILHIYPHVEENSKGFMYNDAGDGYEDGRVDNFELVRHPDGLELFWEQEGDYSFPFQGIRLYLHGFQLEQIWMNGQEVEIKLENNSQAYCEIENQFEQIFFKGKHIH